MKLGYFVDYEDLICERVYVVSVGREKIEILITLADLSSISCVFCIWQSICLNQQTMMLLLVKLPCSDGLLLMILNYQL